jgi:hypothetical protein
MPVGFNRFVHTQNKAPTTNFSTEKNVGDAEREVGLRESGKMQQ